MIFVYKNIKEMYICDDLLLGFINNGSNNTCDVPLVATNVFDEGSTTLEIEELMVPIEEE